MAQLEQIGQSLADVLGLSPTNTYVINQAQFKLEQPTLDFSPTKSVKERIEEGLLGFRAPSIKDKIGEGLLSTKALQNALGLSPIPQEPQGASFVDVMKSPQEYTSLVYERALPLIAKGAPLGVDFSKAVSSVVEERKKAYEKVEEEAKKWREIEAKIPFLKKKYYMLAKKYGADLDDSAITTLAIGRALGFITAEDDKLLFKRKATVKDIELDSGDHVGVIVDENTGKVLKSFPIPLDLGRFKKRKEVEEGVKAKYKKQVGGSGTTDTWEPAMNEFKEPVVFTLNGTRYMLYRGKKTGRLMVLDLDNLRWLTPEEFRKIRAGLSQTQPWAQGEEGGWFDNLWDNIRETIGNIFGGEETKLQQQPLGSKLSKQGSNVFRDYVGDIP